MPVTVMLGSRAGSGTTCTCNWIPPAAELNPKEQALSAPLQCGLMVMEPLLAGAYE
jgi:hypothetical protein